MPSYRLVHPLKGTMILTLRVMDESVAPNQTEILSMFQTCVAICVDDIGYLLEEYERISKMTDSPNHSVIADSPDHWILNQPTIPQTTATILPRRSPRTSWKIATSLLRDGS